jgi:hypothetical protein
VRLGLYLLRPPIVLGPHAVGGKAILPGPLETLGRRLFAGLRARWPLPLIAPAPRLPAQFIHEDDVGQGFMLCIVGAGPLGIYNIAGDGVLTGDQLIRELGLTPIPVPGQARLGSGARPGRRAGPALRAAGDRVGRGAEPPVDHGHGQGEARAPKYTSLGALRDARLVLRVATPRPRMSAPPERRWNRTI